MHQFYEITPSIENYWRSIVLFGRNVASYKFALAKSLFDLSKNPNDLISLEELAVPFSSHLTEHIKTSDKQGTSSTSQFLDACRKFNRNEISHQALVDETTRKGFNNVINAFHIVNQEEIPERFFIDERSSNKGIRITDNLYKLVETSQYVNLPQEVEARWRLVETAWELNISRNLIQVAYDPEVELLFTKRFNKRIDITSCRDSLNGYQKGKCFHCFDEISIKEDEPAIAEVDHFFPHILKQYSNITLLDGVWNLVLSCQSCNRGEDGKFAKVPSKALLVRLHTRNEYLINSHHPLRETLISQTGSDENKRKHFLQKVYDTAKTILIHEWQPKPLGVATF